MGQSYGQLLLNPPAAPVAAFSPVCLPPYVALTPIVITRPNDVTPYAIGDVFGAAADARITVPCGLAPLASFQLRLLVVQHRAPTAAAVSIGFLPFIGAPPATVIGDNAPLALSDADILLQMNSGLGQLGLNFGTTGGLNFSADPNGRRMGWTPMASLRMPVGGDGKIYFYAAFFGTTWTPLALEVMTLYPFLFIAS